MFKNRKEAGKLLGEALSFLKTRKGDVVVLAIPRGGVPVAKEVAEVLGAPLDVIITRKIGAPDNPELAIGAVTQDGQVMTDPGLLEALRVKEGYVREEAARQVEEIRRRMREFRGDRPFPDLTGKTVVLVDDGVATGSTIRAAIESVKARKAGEIILAVPVGAPDSISKLTAIAGQVVCLSTPDPFYAIGDFYQEFEQVDDETVREILRSVRTSS